MRATSILGGPMYYLGLDLHKRYVTACVIDKDGTVVARERRLDAMVCCFARHAAC